MMLPRAPSMICLDRPPAQTPTTQREAEKVARIHADQPAQDGRMNVCVVSVDSFFGPDIETLIARWTNAIDVRKGDLTANMEIRSTGHYHLFLPFKHVYRARLLFRAILDDKRDLAYLDETKTMRYYTRDKVSRAYVEGNRRDSEGRVTATMDELP